MPALTGTNEHRAALLNTGTTCLLIRRAGFETLAAHKHVSPAQTPLTSPWFGSFTTVRSAPGRLCFESRPVGRRHPGRAEQKIGLAAEPANIFRPPDRFLSQPPAMALMVALACLEEPEDRARRGPSRRPPEDGGRRGAGKILE